MASLRERWREDPALRRRTWGTLGLLSTLLFGTLTVFFVHGQVIAAQVRDAIDAGDLKSASEQLRELPRYDLVAFGFPSSSEILGLYDAIDDAHNQKDLQAFSKLVAAQDPKAARHVRSVTKQLKAAPKNRALRGALLSYHEQAHARCTSTSCQHDASQAILKLDPASAERLRARTRALIDATGQRVRAAEDAQLAFREAALSRVMLQTLDTTPTSQAQDAAFAVTETALAHTPLALGMPRAKLTRGPDLPVRMMKRIHPGHLVLAPEGEELVTYFIFGGEASLKTLAMMASFRTGRLDTERLASRVRAVTGEPLELERLTPPPPPKPARRSSKINGRTLWAETTNEQVVTWEHGGAKAHAVFWQGRLQMVALGALRTGYDGTAYTLEVLHHEPQRSKWLKFDDAYRLQRRVDAIGPAAPGIVPLFVPRRHVTLPSSASAPTTPSARTGSPGNRAASSGGPGVGK